ncbi:hypothetical protein [uncultured Pseudokineococcus sp.]|uniref:hypothetical protein n=1 Tax=uncultured Pseudokineococcus sp. TaxID=1642928 RepID=UPI00261092FC|nr:hypothetical protein [uncultured Pseudokineococcus sp.]
MPSPMNDALRAFAADTRVEGLTARPADEPADTSTTADPPADTGQGAGRQSVPSPSPSMGALLRALAGS